MKKRVPYPPLPAGRTPGSGRKKKRWLRDYEAIGPLPADPLAAVEWGFRALMVSLSKTIADPEINEATRSREIKSHLRSMKDLIPKARIAEAERVVAAFEKQQAQPQRPAEDEAKVTAVAATEATDATSSDSRSPIGIDYRALRTGRR
jgi:hypothetical protein